MNEGFYELPGFSTVSSLSEPLSIVRFLADPIDTSSGGNLGLNRIKAAWVLAAVYKLEALGRRQTGWDSYGGLPLQPEARLLTIKAIQQLDQEELPVPSVVLGSAGTVQLEWRRSGKELVLDLADKDQVEYAKCFPNGEVDGDVADWNSKGQFRDLAKWLLE